MFERDRERQREKEQERIVVGCSDWGLCKHSSSGSILLSRAHAALLNEPPHVRDERQREGHKMHSKWMALVPHLLVNWTDSSVPNKLKSPTHHICVSSCPLSFPLSVCFPLKLLFYHSIIVLTIDIPECFSLCLVLHILTIHTHSHTNTSYLIAMSSFNLLPTSTESQKAIPQNPWNYSLKDIRALIKFQTDSPYPRVILYNFSKPPKLLLLQVFAGDWFLQF